MDEGGVLSYTHFLYAFNGSDTKSSRLGVIGTLCLHKARSRVVTVKREPQLQKRGTALPYPVQQKRLQLAQLRSHPAGPVLPHHSPGAGPVLPHHSPRAGPVLPYHSPGAGSSGSNTQQQPLRGQNRAMKSQAATFTHRGRLEGRETA